MDSRIWRSMEALCVVGVEFLSRGTTRVDLHESFAFGEMAAPQDGSVFFFFFFSTS